MRARNLKNLNGKVVITNLVWGVGVTTSFFDLGSPHLWLTFRIKRADQSGQILISILEMDFWARKTYILIYNTQK